MQGSGYSKPGPGAGPGITREALEELYFRFNRREWVHPDPVEFLYAHEDPRDREIVGIVASSLAYGRVAQIHGSVTAVVERMGPAPSRFLRDTSPSGLRRRFRHFRHRFTDGDQLASLLINVQRMIAQFGSLEKGFASGMSEGDVDVLPALAAFAERLGAGSEGDGSMFLPSPRKGSACKRFHLFLRWMARRDEVDPGGWDGISPSMLIVPLDTHMHRIGAMLGFTARRRADACSALEITGHFRRITPEDPVKYDFALTRSGILNNEEVKAFLRRYAV